MKKITSLIILFVLIALVLYHSVYFEKLDVRRERQQVENFNPGERVDYFWEHKLDSILESAMDLEQFDAGLQNAPQALAEQHGRSVGITSSYCFLVKGTTQTQVQANKLAVIVPDAKIDYQLKTKFIFGNTARDALGYFHIDDFENTMDFNAIASELNNRIMKTEISQLDSLSKGTPIEFIGAISVNVENSLQTLEIIPIKILVRHE